MEGNYLELRNTEISEQSMIDFIESMPSLKSLDIRYGIGFIWSFKLFITVAQQENLKKLHLPDFLDSWIPHLASFPHGSLFPNIKTLGIGLSDTTFETVRPYLSQIEVLYLHMDGDARCTLINAATCRNLHFFLLTLLSDEVLRETEILSLLDNCPILEILRIRKYDQDSGEAIQITCEDITDATIEHLARSRAAFTDLDLRIADSPLTEKSLLAFGTYCQSLTAIAISADVDLEALLQGDHQSRFPDLKRLNIFPPASGRRHYRDPEQVAKRLLEAAPYLITLNLGAENLTPSEEVVNGIVNELIKEKFK